MAAKAIDLRQLAFREVSNGRMSTDEALELLEREHHEEVSRSRLQAFWTWLTVAAIGVVLLVAFSARAQAGDAPNVPPAAQIAPPVFVPMITSTPTPAPATTVPWGELLVGLLTAAYAWYMKNESGKVHAATIAAASASTSTPAKMGLTVLDKVESLVESAAGHALPDVQAALAAGKDAGTVTNDAAKDLALSLGDGLKSELTAHFGVAGGALVDYLEGLIKARVQSAQAAGAAAAAKVTTPAAAVAAFKVALPAAPVPAAAPVVAAPAAPVKPA